jgi:uncharacterized protein (DUF2267 family)
MKKSLIEINTLPRDPSTGWQFRLDEVQAADGGRTKFLAGHHFSRALDQELHGGIRRAIEGQSEFAKMPKAELKAVGTQRARDAETAVFLSFRIMDRLEPGIAAIQKSAGGDLPRDLREIWQQIWQTLEKADEVRKRFYAVNSSAERLSIDLSEEIGPLCDELQSLIVALYNIARARYGLPELNGRVIQ